MADSSAAIDAVAARNNTLVLIRFNGKRVGRIQQIRSEQANNVQVLAELGRDVMVEFLRGIRSYSFSISSFVVHADVMDTLKDGAVFSLEVVDNGVGQVLESFARCMIQSLSRSYTNGQAAIGQDASVVVIGHGIGAPTH